MAATAPAAEQRNGNAVAGFVCGLLGLVTSVFLFFLFFPVVLDALGIFFSIRGRRAAAAGARQGGLATAGLVLAIIGLVIFVLWMILAAIGAGIAEERGG